MTTSTQTPVGKRRVRLPKLRDNASLLRKIAAEKVTIRDAAGTRQLTVLEAIILRLQYKAIRVDLRADKRLDVLRERLAPRHGQPAALLVVPGMADEADWIRQANIQNQFAAEPELDPPPPHPSEPSAQPKSPTAHRSSTPIPRQARRHLIR